jgi:hypothetical protein
VERSTKLQVKSTEDDKKITNFTEILKEVAPNLKKSSKLRQRLMGAIKEVDEQYDSVDEIDYSDEDVVYREPRERRPRRRSSAQLSPTSFEQSPGKESEDRPLKPTASSSNLKGSGSPQKQGANPQAQKPDREVERFMTPRRDKAPQGNR